MPTASALVLDVLVGVGDDDEITNLTHVQAQAAISTDAGHVVADVSSRPVTAIDGDTATEDLGPPIVIVCAHSTHARLDGGDLHTQEGSTGKRKVNKVYVP